MSSALTIIRQVGEQIVDPFVLTDAAGRTEWVNPAFVELCGHTTEQLLGKKPGHVLQGEDTDPESVARIRRAVAAGGPCDARLLNYHRDGHPYWVEVRIRPLQDLRGELTHFFAIEREIAAPDSPARVASATAQEIVTLCATCYKVRTAEHGWQAFETYWRRRAGVRFSHGSCPDCLNRWR